jgi:hypothetical protein
MGLVIASVLVVRAWVGWNGMGFDDELDPRPFAWS